MLVLMDKLLMTSQADVRLQPLKLPNLSSIDAIVKMEELVLKRMTTAMTLSADVDPTSKEVIAENTSPGVGSSLEAQQPTPSSPFSLFSWL